jgi:hypothetical protein
MAPNTRALVCCTDDHRFCDCRRVLSQDYDREYNDGSGTDDCEIDFRVSDHDWISAEGGNYGQPEETWNIPLEFEDVSEDFESNVEEGVKIKKVSVNG